MPRGSRGGRAKASAARAAAAEPAREASVGVVLDNGGSHVKAAAVPLGGGAVRRTHATNARARGAAGTLVGREVDLATDFSGMSFRRALDRGYVARWDVSRDVWAGVLGGEGLAVDARDASLLVTEPPANMAHMREAMDELVFEVAGFAEYAAATPAALAAYGEGARWSGVVLDAGFSFAHATPVHRGAPLRAATRRLGAGGKLLTNVLKETVTFRSWNMTDETAVVNAAKERVCRVAQDFPAALAASRAADARAEYVLPDLSRAGADPLGHVRAAGEAGGQVLVLGNERVAVPEVLFAPADIGIRQAGVHELVAQAVAAAPDALRADLYADVLLVGGCARLHGFRARVERGLRPLVADVYGLRVRRADDPVWAACDGGVKMFRGGERPWAAVTRAEYHEHGHRITAERFFGAPPQPPDEVA